MNEIVSLESGVFQGLDNLIKLCIYNNRLEELPPGIFSNLPALRWLNIGLNQLSTLDESVFPEEKPSWIDLAISGNPLECDESLCWLYASGE